MNEQLKAKVIEASSNPDFIHHEWFVKYHLEVVERIARELCGIYALADPSKVAALVWLHDYEKIIDFDNQYNTDLAATRRLMQDIGYDSQTIEEFAGLINVYNAKQELSRAPIEVQIVSSADAASHVVGPFITLYWYENPTTSISQLQAENRRKLAKDWDAKITLPEVRRAFEPRFKHAMEIAGELPDSYLS